MKKLNSLNVTKLRVEEDFGFQKLVVAETSNLPGEEAEGGSAKLTAGMKALKDAFDAFDAALKDSANVPSTRVAAQADADRDVAWRSLEGYLQAMKACPDSDKAEKAAAMHALLDKYGNPTALPQTEESGVLHNLLQDLEACDEADRKAVNADLWINDLKTKEEAFLEAVAKRTEEESARIVGIVKESRRKADEAYKALADTVNALMLLNGEEPYATFVDHVNTLVDRQRTVLKTRRTVNAKSRQS